MRLLTALFALALCNLVGARKKTPNDGPSGTVGTRGGASGSIHLRSESLDVTRLLKTHPPEKLKAKIRAQREAGDEKGVDDGALGMYFVHFADAGDAVARQRFEREVTPQAFMAHKILAPDSQHVWCRQPSRPDNTSRFSSAK